MTCGGDKKVRNPPLHDLECTDMLSILKVFMIALISFHAMCGINEFSGLFEYFEVLLEGDMSWKRAGDIIFTIYASMIGICYWYTFINALPRLVILRKFKDSKFLPSIIPCIHDIQTWV